MIKGLALFADSAIILISKRSKLQDPNLCFGQLFTGGDKTIMINNDPLVAPVNPDRLPPVAGIYPSTELQTKAKTPNKFLSVLGSVAGGALNYVIPGLGGILGSIISGGGSNAGSYVGLMDQQRQMQEMMQYNQVANMLQQQNQNQMLQQQQQQSMQLLAVQHRSSMQSQEFSTVSNLLKSRHDSEMTAVNNIKS